FRFFFLAKHANESTELDASAHAIEVHWPLANVENLRASVRKETGSDPDLLGEPHHSATADVPQALQMELRFLVRQRWRVISFDSHPAPRELPSRAERELGRSDQSGSCLVLVIVDSTHENWIPPGQSSSKGELSTSSRRFEHHDPWRARDEAYAQMIGRRPL